MQPSTGEGMRLLKAWCKGDAAALEQLAPVVRDDDAGILVNHAVARGRRKRGGSALPRFHCRMQEMCRTEPRICALDEVLQELAKLDDRKSRLIELPYFGGLTAEETAEVLGISLRTVHREWDLTLSWLFRALRR
jgi:DNA-directed RNA polymerase specialized sigma24 family protein